MAVLEKKLNVSTLTSQHESAKPVANKTIVEATLIATKDPDAQDVCQPNTRRSKKTIEIAGPVAMFTTGATQQYQTFAQLLENGESKKGQSMHKKKKSRARSRQLIPPLNQP